MIYRPSIMILSICISLTKVVGWNCLRTTNKHVALVTYSYKGGKVSVRYISSSCLSATTPTTSSTPTAFPNDDDNHDEEKPQQQQFVCCYLLRSTSPSFSKSTYIGYTTDPKRRLRQHNGELKYGGAKRTRAAGKRPWEYVVVVHGFRNKTAALQFEWAWQHPGKSRRFVVDTSEKGGEAINDTTNRKSLETPIHKRTSNQEKAKERLLVDREEAKNIGRRRGANAKLRVLAALLGQPFYQQPPNSGKCDVNVAFLSDSWNTTFFEELTLLQRTLRKSNASDKCVPSIIGEEEEEFYLDLCSRSSVVATFDELPFQQTSSAVKERTKHSN